MKCSGCKGKAQKNPNKDEYSHYEYYCPSCETYLFERQVIKPLSKMKKGELVNEVFDQYSESGNWETAIELITGRPLADLLSDVIFETSGKMTIPELKALIKELKAIDEWKAPTPISGRGVSQ